jgi:hypothetical protein
MSASIAERYIRAAHGVNLHKTGFIDAYFGNPDWTQAFSSNLNDLAVELERLQNDVLEISSSQRRAYLSVQIRAMRTMVKLKSGVSISFLDEVRGLHDIEPIRKPEHLFEAAHQKLEQLLPGTGSLNDRRQVSRDKFKIDPNRIQAVIDVISLESQQRTKTMFGLPENESCQYALVQNKPWGGYNWYLGHGRSRIDVNTDLPQFVSDLPDLVAHESYPGHHTEHVKKEQKLVLENDWQEFGIQLLDSPECVLAEGIATSALGVIMDKSELARWITDELCKVAGLNLSFDEVQTELQIQQARAALNYVSGNAALMLFENLRSEVDVLEYIQHYQLLTPTQAQKKLEFVQYARAYVYTYTTGYDLLEPLLVGTDKAIWFQRLLEQPVTPSQLKSWALETLGSKP